MSKTIKVLTYNIHHGADCNEIPGLKHIGDTIKKTGAQVVALQEVDYFMPRSRFSLQPRSLGKTIGADYIFGHNISRLGVFRYGNAILSRLPVIDYSNIPLPYLSERRGLLKALIRVDKHTGFYLLCTHLGLSAPERQAQTEYIYEIIRKLQLPCILAGDFNCGPEARELMILKDCLNNAAGAVIGEYLTFPSYRPGYCLDYIMASREWKVIDARIPESKASDHLPLLAELELN